jgi:hypothetical protein
LNICDVCGKESEIVGKLHFIPSIPGVTKLNHSQYTHHADVGKCCKERLFTVLKFQNRMSKAQYNELRKNGKRKSYSR